MGWTYLAGRADNDFVRLKIGDTNKDDPQLQDEEIAVFLDQYPPMYAAVYACRALAAKYTRQINRSIGRLKIDTADRAAAYLAMARSLQSEADSNAVPYAGGLSLSEKAERGMDPDVNQNVFRRDLHEMNERDPLLSETTV